MQSKVIWKGKMFFEGSADSGHTISIDSDASVGGEDKAVRPMELIALGLAGCTGMDVISILQKKKQAVTKFEVRVDAPRAREHPKVFTSAVINYVIDGKDIDESAVLRAIELSVTKYCPAQAMLAQAFPMNCRYEIYEQGKLVKQGEWKPA